MKINASDIYHLLKDTKTNIVSPEMTPQRRSYSSKLNKGMFIVNQAVVELIDLPYITEFLSGDYPIRIISPFETNAITSDMNFEMIDRCLTVSTQDGTVVMQAFSTAKTGFDHNSVIKVGGPSLLDNATCIVLSGECRDATIYLDITNYLYFGGKIDNKLGGLLNIDTIKEFIQMSLSDYSYQYENLLQGMAEDFKLSEVDYFFQQAAVCDYSDYKIDLNILDVLWKIRNQVCENPSAYPKEDIATMFSEIFDSMENDIEYDSFKSSFPYFSFHDEGNVQKANRFIDYLTNLAQYVNTDEANLLPISVMIVTDIKYYENRIKDLVSGLNSDVISRLKERCDNLGEETVSTFNHIIVSSDDVESPVATPSLRI